MKLYRVALVFACIAIGVTIGGVALLLDTEPHAHDDSDAEVLDIHLRAVDNATVDLRRVADRLRELEVAELRRRLNDAPMPMRAWRAGL